MASIPSSDNPYETIWRVSLSSIRKNNQARLFTFPHQTSHEFEFQVELYKKGDSLNIILQLIKGKEGVHCFDYRISFLDGTGRMRYLIGGYGEFEVGDINMASKQRHTVSVDYLMKRACVRGGISIHCEVDVPGWEKLPKYVAIESTKLYQDMYILLNSGEFSDVTLLFGDGHKEFLVHKLILASRSPVFRAMFQHKSKENLEGRVKIPDIEEDVGEELLRYMYTEQVPKMDRISVELLVAADKYQLETLKRECNKSLCANLAIDSVAKIFILADMHQVVELKEKCINFITEHPKEVVATEGWKDVTTRPDLLTILFEKIIGKL